MSRMSIYALMLAASAALAAPAGAQQAQVALGEPVSVETLAMAIAFERAKEKGVDLKITSFSKEELAVQAVISGQAQIGIATPYSVMQKSQGTVKNLVSLTRLVFFPIVEKATYKTWKDLNGQPFTFHARGSGTEAIGNIMAKRQGIQFGQRNYISGSDNRIVALMNGQIKATILDLPNTKILMEKAGDRFAALPGVENPSSDEILFARTDWIEKNKDKVDILVKEFVNLWDEMAEEPGDHRDRARQARHAEGSAEGNRGQDHGLLHHRRQGRPLQDRRRRRRQGGLRILHRSRPAHRLARRAEDRRFLVPRALRQGGQEVADFLVSRGNASATVSRSHCFHRNNLQQEARRLWRATIVPPL